MRVYIIQRPKRRYTTWNFIFDATLVLLTGGLWFIWIFVREVAIK